MAQRADTALTAYVALYAQLATLQQQLNACITDGWLQLSVARKSMGVAAVSSMAIPASLTAARCARAVPDGACGQRWMLVDSHESEQLLRHKIQDDIDSRLRQRRRPPEEALADLSLQEDKAAAQQAQRLADPIRWFGVLVPPALRQAQKAFLKGLEIAVDMTNVRCDMEAQRRAYFEALEYQQAQALASHVPPQIKEKEPSAAVEDRA